MKITIVKARRRSKKEAGLAERLGSDYKAMRRMAKIDPQSKPKRAAKVKKVTVRTRYLGTGR